MDYIQAHLDQVELRLNELLGPKKHVLPAKAQLDILQRLGDLTETTSLAESLSHLQRYSKSPASMVYTDMLNALQAGNLATSALRGWFDEYVVKGLQVAEDRSLLNKALRNTVLYMQEQSQTVGPALRSLIYPTVILVMAMAVGTLVFLNIQDTMSQTKVRFEDLPTPFHVLYWVTQFATGYIYPILALIGAGLYLGYGYLKNNFSPLREKTLDNMMIFREYRMLLVSQFLNTFTLLIDQGVKEIEAVAIIRGNDTTSYMAKHLIRMEGRIKGGTKRSEALNTGLFDDEAASLLAAVGETKHFNAGLKRVAKESQRRFLRNIALYAMAVKGIFFAIAVVVALNIFGAVMGLEEIFTT